MEKYLVFTDNSFPIFKFYLPVSLDTFDEMLKHISWFIGKGVTKTDSVYDKNGQEILVFNFLNWKFFKFGLLVDEEKSFHC